MRVVLLQGLLTEPLCFISYINVILSGSDKHGRSVSFADKGKKLSFLDMILRMTQSEKLCTMEIYGGSFVIDFRHRLAMRTHNSLI